METTIRTQEKGFGHELVKENNEVFISELAKGYLWFEIDKLEQRLNEFSEEFEALNDKESLKGQYLEVFIYNLKTEIKEKKKLYAIY